MYNTKKVLNNDLDTIINKIAEYGIYQHYIGDFKVNTIFNSPLRKDNNPSFGVFVSKSTGKLLFKDLATGETGNCIKFVKIGLILLICPYGILKLLKIKSKELTTVSQRKKAFILILQ